MPALETFTYRQPTYSLYDTEGMTHALSMKTDSP